MSPVALAASAAPASAAEVSALFDRAISEVFLAESADNAHDPSVLTMSALGGCTRLGAYQMAGYAPTDMAPQEKRAAHLGTALHLFLLPRLARVFGGHWSVIEEPVTLRTPQGDITGTLDMDTELGTDTLMYSPDTTSGHALADLKTCSSYLFDQINASGQPRTKHLMQGVGYAVARTQAGYPVRWVSIIYVDRESGRSRTLTVELTRQLAAMVFERVAELARYAQHPETAPRDERGPGLSVVCDGCTQLRRCWGRDATAGRTGAQAVAAISDADVVAAARSYHQARTARLELEKWEEFWKLVLNGRDGTYTHNGASVRVSMRPGAKRKDQSAAYALLEQRGIAVPMTQNQPSLVAAFTEAPG